jgi:hemerythrin-like domain-containing protein
MPSHHRSYTLRSFVTAAAFVLAACASGQRPLPEGPAATEKFEVTAIEDLMREHGALRRLLWVYVDYVENLTAKSTPTAPLARAAAIVRSFVENYHEKLEEEFIFPRCRQADVLTEMVAILQTQHDVGRAITDRIIYLANRPKLSQQERRQLRHYLIQYVVMYQPHAAREETVVFPTLHYLVGAHEYEELGEVFEQRETELFGPNGFEKTIADIAAIEKELDLFDLRRYTPPAPINPS